MDTLVVVLIIGGAAFGLLRRVYRIFSRSRLVGCGCGCPGCTPTAEDLPPVDIQPSIAETP